MNLLDSGFLKEIYTQTGNLHISGDISLLNTGSIFSFGISGFSRSSILFSGGKIFDCNNNFIDRYAVNDIKRVDININRNKYSLSIDNKYIVLGQSRNQTGNINYIFADSVGESTLDFVVNGQIPNYSITSNITFLDSEDLNPIVGHFINNDIFNITIYSGAMSRNNNFSLQYDTGVISPGGTGNFTFYPQTTGLVGGFLLPYQLHTNFGIVQTGAILSGYSLVDSGYILNLFGSTGITSNTIETYFAEVESRSGDFYATAFLQHISGSGFYKESTDYSGIGTGNDTGYITEFGYLYLSKSINGTGTGGIYGQESGLFTGNFISGRWATGNFSHTFQITGTGIGTGIGFTGLSTGVFNYNINGTILDGSGSYIFSGFFTGAPSQSYSLGPAFFRGGTGAIYYNTPISTDTSDILYVGNSYFGIVYSFHHTSRNSLITYLNNNQSRHKVFAIASGSNDIFLSGLEGFDSNNVILYVDPDNNGDMAVSGPTLLGGYDSGYSYPVVATSVFTGFSNQRYINSGYYTGLYNGLLTGTGLITIIERKYTDIWDLVTGDAAASEISYNTNGYLIGNQYFNVQTTNSSFNIAVKYNDSFANATDIVRLYLSGTGLGGSVFTFIDITGR